jgi:hypothetical protein
MGDAAVDRGDRGGLHGGEARSEPDFSRSGAVDGEDSAVDVVTDPDRRGIADAGIAGHVVDDRGDGGSLVVSMVGSEFVERRRESLRQPGHTVTVAQCDRAHPVCGTVRPRRSTTW